MSTWTKMKIEKQVEIEWADMLKRFVLCKTLHGTLTESVESLRRKVQDRHILAPIRAVYEDMLAFAESKSEGKNDEDKKEPPTRSGGVEQLETRIGSKGLESI